ncbi:MAG: hypothetical protein MJ078_06645 [Clostridia bacterium]|nr:hypothetical protein [Clostridia bacterium]
MKNEYTVTEYGVRPGADELQTELLQKVFDFCRAEGGTVIFPAGRYRTGGLRMWSDTEVRLLAGAELIGSDVCEDYPVFPVPEGVELRTDLELISQYYENRLGGTYRIAVFSAYGGKHSRTPRARRASAVLTVSS